MQVKPEDPSSNVFLRGEVRWPANMEIRAKSVAGHFKGSRREETTAKARILKNPSTAVASVMKQLQYIGIVYVQFRGQCK